MRPIRHDRSSRHRGGYAAWTGVALGLVAALTQPAASGERSAGTAPLTVTRPALQPFPPQVPPPIAVVPGTPLTSFDASILDGETRFPTPGPAEARCPGERVVFVFGVINPLRPTLPGDGAFMCRRDAIAQGYLSR